MIVLFLYVEDIVLTGSCDKFLEDFIADNSSEFEMKDLGNLDYFLGIEISQTPSGLLLRQSKYANDILTRAQMDTSGPLSTPLMTKPGEQSLNEPFTDVTLFCSLVGVLQYLTITHPNLMHTVNRGCQYMHAPTVRHYANG